MFRQRKRFRRKLSAPPPKKILLITMILFTLFVTMSIWTIGKGIKPVLMEIAEAKLNEFATRGINSAVRFAEDYNFEDVVIITYDNEGHPATYNWDPAVISEINRVATDRVEEFFINVNRGDPLTFENPLEEPHDYSDGAEDRAKQDPTLVEIPLGQITKNPVLANLGPKIPINFEIVGNVKTNVVRKKEAFGINGAWMSLYIDVQANVQIVIPFTTEVAPVSTEIYIDSGVIMGDVPQFYGGDGDNPSIAIPKDSLKDE